MSVKSEEEKYLKNKFKTICTCKGKSISIEDWECAEEKAKKYNIFADPTVKQLLNALNPIENRGNHDITQHYSFSMSAETNKSLDVDST